MFFYTISLPFSAQSYLNYDQYRVVVSTFKFTKLRKQTRPH